MTADYQPINDVAFDDWWTPDNHNQLLANVEAAWYTATRKQLFPSLPAYAPLSGIQAAGIDLLESTGAGTAKPIIPRILFDDSTDEARMFVFRMPWTPETAPVLKIKYYMVGANSSKNVCFVAKLAAVSDTDTSVTAKVFAADNAATTTVPNAAGTEDEASITLTNNDGLVKGDWCCLSIMRDVSEDTAVGDCAVTDIEMQFG